MTESDDDIVGRRVITDINQTPAELWVSFTHHPDDPEAYHIEDFDTVRAAVYGAPFRYVRRDLQRPTEAEIDAAAMRIARAWGEHEGWPELSAGATLDTMAGGSLLRLMARAALQEPRS